MPKEAKLRGRSKRRNGPYPLGELPPSLAVNIGKRICHRLAVGANDIEGNDFGAIFAQSVGGHHRGKPLGLADVSWENCAWSVKTLKSKNPFTVDKIRVISGRMNVKYSFGIENPFADIAATGEAVLKIWNGRMDEALSEYDDLRIFMMVRNMDALEFTLIEIEPFRYVPSEFKWELNDRDNLLGFDRQKSQHHFTFQPEGKQFTVHRYVPASAYRFRIAKKPGMIEQRQILDIIGFDDSWIVPVPAPVEGESPSQ